MTKNHKNIDIYYTGYITIKSLSDYKTTKSVNPLHLMVSELDGYIEEKNRNKYSTFTSTDKNKKV